MTEFIRSLWIAFAALILLPTLAFAHAQLTGTAPASSELVLTAPDNVVLEFNEPAAPVAMRWISPDGSSSKVEAKSEALKVIVDPPPPSGDGTYLLSWRVVSLDGHPVSGTLIFSIGAPSDVPSLNAANWPPASTWAAIGTKFLLTVCLVLGVGGTVFFAFVSQNLGSGLRIICGALWLALPVALLSVTAQGIDLLGAPLSGLLSIEAWSMGASTSIVRTAAVAALAALIALGLMATSLRENTKARNGAALVAWILAAVSYALSGHTAVAEPETTAFIAISIHGFALLFWLGSLLPIYVVLKTDGTEVSLRRFSTMAVPLVLALLISGGIMTSIHAGDGGFRAMGLAGYGVLLLVKLMAVVGLLALALYNRFSLTPAIAAGQPGAAQALRGAIRVEVVLAVVIIAFASSFRLTPPPVSLSEAPQSWERAFVEGVVRAEIEMIPGRVGQNAFRIDLYDEGAELDEHATELPRLVPVELKVSMQFAGEEMAPIVTEATLTDEGIWTAGPVNLPLEGNWDLTLEVLVTDFDLTKMTTGLTLPR